MEAKAGGLFPGQPDRYNKHCLDDDDDDDDDDDSDEAESENNNESDETISNAIIINDSDESDHEMIMLPHWASSPFEFVYKHRLLLESKSVNEYLGDWIHEVFGPQMKIKFGHTKLFNSSKISRCLASFFISFCVQS